MYEARRQKLAGLLKENQLDAAIIVPGSNMYYFTGLNLKQSERLTLAVLTSEGEVSFVVPQVELNKVEEIATGKVYWYKDEYGPSRALNSLKADIGRIQKAGVEYDQMRVMELRAAELLTEDITDISSIISTLRLYKDEQEIKYMQQAVKILEESLDATLPYIKPGVTEVEIAAQLEFEMRKRGSEGTPFGTIVASGPRGASPHGRASDKRIESGELIVMDFGSLYKGYVGDICRTVAVGEIDSQLKEIYEIVREAQQAALNIIKPGITAHDVDEKARSIIRERGYGDYFTHRTGHGLGLNAHEEPYMMQNNKIKLEPGIAFTVEPGIYLPGKGGVRIEDNVIITKDGFLNLMSYPKDLITL